MTGAPAVTSLRLAPKAARVLRVMQVTDWLEPGGKERVAVNLANLLPRDRFRSFLCTTRKSSGVLENAVAADVHRLRLDRNWCFDLGAIKRLAAFNAANRIDVLHAHGSSLFIAALASLLPPYPAVIWHDHYGPYRRDDRPAWLYRLAAQRISGVIAVNQPLLEWSRQRLGVPATRAWYLPNFVCPPAVVTPRNDLPGPRGRRIACVAHLRPQKDHVTLLHAFAAVVRHVPDAHLLLIGGVSDAAYARRLHDLINQLRLATVVTVMGSQEDVPGILAQCDIGVLSSESEGFPLALIEYGSGGLPAVATSVGQCPEILDNGLAGLLVPAGDAAELARSLTHLLTRPDRRRVLGQALHDRVNLLYSAAALLDRVSGIYETVCPPGSKPMTFPARS